MKKTSKKVTLVQHMHNRNDSINRCVYEDERGREFVIVNRCFVPLESYETDFHYNVFRY